MLSGCQSTQGTGETQLRHNYQSQTPPFQLSIAPDFNHLTSGKFDQNIQTIDQPASTTVTTSIEVYARVQESRQVKDLIVIRHEQLPSAFYWQAPTRDNALRQEMLKLDNGQFYLFIYTEKDPQDNARYQLISNTGYKLPECRIVLALLNSAG